MSHTQESKENLQSNNLWFQKSNYMGKFLSEKSKEIINKLNKKNMKNLIFTMLLAPFLSFAQQSYTDALLFQNNIRSYYDLQMLNYNNDLALAAQEWADYMAKTDTFEVSNDVYGENIFYISRDYAMLKNKNVLLEASLNWILEPGDDYSTYNQIIYPEATEIGFGISHNEEAIYIVAKYNKLYE